MCHEHLPYSYGTFSVPATQHAHSTMGSPHLFFTVELKTIFSTSCTCTQNCPLMGVPKAACFILRIAGCHHVYPKRELFQKRGSNLPFHLFLQKVYFLMVCGDYNFLDTGFPCVPVLCSCPGISSVDQAGDYKFLTLRSRQEYLCKLLRF